jgi:Ni,Fe-hydrogenase I large subunit
MARTDALLRVIAPALRRDPEFVRAPTWAGTPVETGALARCRDHPLVAALAAEHGHAVVTRIVARIVDVALLLQEISGAALRPERPPRVQLRPLDSDEGLAAVETARGLLLHRVRLRDGRVADYQIVAPTEWNFHPEGALVRGLEGLTADDGPTLVQRARLAVHALDPCVACQVEVGHA